MPRGLPAVIPHRTARLSSLCNRGASGRRRRWASVVFSSYERRLTCSKATPGTTSSRRSPHGIAPRQRKLAKSEQLRAQFVERLPSTAWAGLSLADYVLGENNQDVVSYWMEFKDGLTPSMKAALTGTSLEVSAQQSFGAVVVGESTGRPYSTIRADLATVDTQSGRMVPVDINTSSTMTSGSAPATSISSSPTPTRSAGATRPATPVSSIPQQPP